MTQPTYYKALWHNCNSCHIHYMSEHPHIRAYLCDECWNKLPHFKVNKIQQTSQTKRKPSKEYTIGQILLYSIGNLLCIGVITYFLWFK